jgi:teichuronic acid biosynthesis glycosyltransferase TuaG
MNLVTIVMPCYNSKLYLLEAVKSVLSQTYTSWELIIVDDCSTDGSDKLIDEIMQIDTRIQSIKLIENSGSAKARNAALKVAKGRFIAFLDSDDIWYSSKLEKQVLFMLEKNIPISFTSYEVIDESGSKKYVVQSTEKLNQLDYLKNTIIGFSTSMIDTKYINNNFRFIDIRTRQDTSLWITLLGMGFVAYGMSEVLASYRVHSQSISSNKYRAVKQVWNLYFNIHKLGFTNSVYYFLYYLFNAIKKRI